jgi:23S rRNA (pseudouridine1915-N3)-methyltransferase
VRLALIAIGRKMPGWVAEGFDEYRKRLPPHLDLDLIELDAGRGSSPVEVQRDEAEKLRARIPPGARVIALDGRGKPWRTEDLARQLEDWQMDGRPVALLVGGASGLNDDVLSLAEQRWSLGPLTLPHMLVRVLLAEQLYRAWSVNAGHPYHK